MVLRSFPLGAILFALMTSTVCNADGPMKIGSFGQEVRTFHTKDNGLPSNDVRNVSVVGGRVIAETSTGSVQLEQDKWVSVTTDQESGEVSTAESELSPELLLLETQEHWDVGNGKGPFWLPGNGGVWRMQFIDGNDGLPIETLTCSSSAGKHVWFGSDTGVVRYDGKNWAYRQGKRWLPSDNVRAIAATEDGGAWIATADGLAHIHFKPMTLKQKAAYYEKEIDLYNRRTEFGFVIESYSKVPGDKSGLTQHDSDNDGLWTAMYGAGECFAWAATKDPAAKVRAKNAFEALRYLSVAPRGGSNPAPKGFIARTVVPVTEPNPNERESYTLEGQIKRQDGDKMWRAYSPRWPTTEDGKYYWKSDTSSDELDGHYFFYGLYYDLVADTEEEKERVREIVRDNIDHMIDHDFCLFDHAGPTRWADYSPKSVNHDIRWFAERGLNSLSMLTYLATAAHITGDSKYLDVAKGLREDHGYHQNVLTPKHQVGIGSGNQSDDEMAFMCFYNIMKYEPDETLRSRYLYSFWNYWRLERPELNPFFNFSYAAVGLGQTYTNQWGTSSLEPDADWLEDSADTLRRFPLDRFDWSHHNSHRADMVKLPGPSIDTSGRQFRPNGKVIPVDETYFNHWNRNAWQPDTGGNGQTLGSGTVFLLPYYMGLYHEFIAD